MAPATAPKTAAIAPKAVETTPKTATTAPKAQYGDYAVTFKDLKLTDAQWIAVAEKVKAMKDALAAWDTENATKLQDATKANADAAKALAEAKKGADAEAISAAELKEKDAAKKLADLQAVRANLAAKGDADVVAVLTPEQKQTYTSNNMFQAVTKRLGKITLTEEQTAKMHTMCDDAAKELLAMERPRPERAQQRLYTQIVDQVLTPEQQAKVKAAESKPASAPAAPRVMAAPQPKTEKPATKVAP